MASDARWLVVFDTDRIKDYIFSTPDLRKIRGGSVLLEHLNRASHADLEQPGQGPRTEASVRTLLEGHAVSEDWVVAAGGLAAAVLPGEADPSRVIEQVERLYASHTRVATITGVALKTTEADLVDGGAVGGTEEPFQHLMARAVARLREVKDQRAPAREIDLAPYLRPCDACRRHPATVPLLVVDGTPEFVCTACRIKDTWGRRGLFWEEFSDFLRTTKGAGDPWLAAAPPEDFTELGDTSTPPGYIGFIYADGNGIGGTLETLGSFPRYRDFSRELDTLVRQTTYATLSESLRGHLGRRAPTAPFEILLLGGDDLMLVVAADAALEVACGVMESFEQRAPQSLGIPLSLSAGVVIAHSSFPLKVLHDLGAELLRFAKRSRRPGEPGRIDFMVVSEAGSQGVGVVRERVLKRKSGRHLDVLTRRPYTPARLRVLIEQAQAARERMPRHQLQALHAGLFSSRYEAQFIGLRLRRRDYDAWDRVSRKLDIEAGLFPFSERSVDGLPGFDTPLVDLIEILDFVPGPRGEGT